MVLTDPRVTLLTAAAGALGACVGSFLNVVAYRLPRECMSIVRPRSRCPRCAAPIAWYDNLPVVSWLFLLGRCRHCRARISARYPAVELMTAGCFVLLLRVVVPQAGLTHPASHPQAWLSVLVMAVITGALIALSLVDLDYRILPDEITKTGIWLGPVLAFLAPCVQHGRPLMALSGATFGPWAPRLSALVSGIAGALVAGLLLWLIGRAGTRLFKKEAMGLGDVKMLAAMGGVLGLWALLALAVAAVSGAVVGVLVRLVTRGRYIPFGPFLALGMWTVMLWGPEILEGYLGFFRPG